MPPAAAKPAPATRPPAPATRPPAPAARPPPPAPLPPDASNCPTPRPAFLRYENLVVLPGCAASLAADAEHRGPAAADFRPEGATRSGPARGRQPPPARRPQPAAG